MDCDECREVLSARLDAEAAEDEDAAVDAHLTRCAPCRALDERLARLTAGLRAGLGRASEPSPGLADTVLARVHGAGDVPLAPVVATVVPAAGCGCAEGCRCGCRDGRACRCGRRCQVTAA